MRKTKKEEKAAQAKCFNAIVEGMKFLGWDKERPAPMPPQSPYENEKD